MNLPEAYHAVNAVLDALDFNALFTGFHKYKYALYTNSVICLDGKMMPYQDAFRGNTAIVHNGEYVAIWNMELDPIDDSEIFAYLLVHEMFHCHQRANGEKRYPSDLILLRYPSDVDNFEKKYQENLYLAEAYEKHDQKALQKFAQIRNMRMNTYPDMVRQELKVETVEGMAEYIGLKALQRINFKKFAGIINDYLCKLRQQDSLLFDVRRICYYSGALYDLCLEKYGMKIHNEFADEQTIYEQNPIALDAGSVEINYYDFISSRLEEIIGEREKRIRESIENWEYTACNAFICGYDPMNMFRVGSFVYCKHFICLNVGGTIQTINASVLLRLDENSDQKIVGYYCAKQHV